MYILEEHNIYDLKSVWEIQTSWILFGIMIYHDSLDGKSVYTGIGKCPILGL